jgi:hypothetical protein
MSPAWSHIDPRAPGLVSPCDGTEFARLFIAQGSRQWHDVARAWAVGDAPELARQLHKLKGSLAIVGARPAMARVGTMEAACAGPAIGRSAGDYEALACEFAGVIAELVRFMRREPGPGLDR